jgi:hypothetical protein
MNARRGANSVKPTGGVRWAARQEGARVSVTRREKTKMGATTVAPKS